MKKLSKKAEKLKKEILDHYDFSSEPQELAVLEMGLLAMDEADRMMVVVEKDGELVPGQKGVLKPHPLLTPIRDNRLIFLRVMRQLDLPTEDEKPKRLGRPPGRGF